MRALILLVVLVFSFATPSLGFELRMSIDAHLHVWSDGAAPFSYVRGALPPDALQATSSPKALMEEMSKAGTKGALIVQPINHLFDHSFVESAIQSHPSVFKGMCLLDPSTEDEGYLRNLKEKGFGSVRFNPYLPEWNGAKMDSEAGLKFYKQCGELNMPVGFMCFKGLNNHIDEIKALLKASPKTKCIIDHWGFFVQEGKVVEESWSNLMGLAKYERVYVKISAPFRNVVDKEERTYMELKGRLRELVDTFGAARVLWGTDFPFVMLEEDNAYVKSVQRVRGWGLTEEEVAQVMSKTAESLLGKWG